MEFKKSGELRWIKKKYPKHPCLVKGNITAQKLCFMEFYLCDPSLFWAVLSQAASKGAVFVQSKLPEQRKSLRLCKRSVLKVSRNAMSKSKHKEQGSFLEFFFLFAFGLLNFFRPPTVVSSLIALEPPHKEQREQRND